MQDFTDYDDDEYTSAPTPAKPSPVEDGDYTAELTELIIKEFDDGGRRFEYTFTLDNGLRIWKKEYIPAKGSADPKDVKKRGYLMADARAVSGRDDIRFTEFCASLASYTGQSFNITKRTKGKYVNVYINDRVAAPAPVAVFTPAPAQSDLPNVPRGAANGAPF